MPFLTLAHCCWLFGHAVCVFGIAAVGAVIGGIVGSVITYCATRRMPPQNAQPATEEDPEPAFGKENDAQTIQFLHEKRYAFFKTRQEHEWKVYFAAWVLLGALDAAVLTGKLPLSGWPIFVFWIPSCLLVFGVVWGYQANLQHANKEDRKALNTLYNRLCGLVGVPKESPVRARTWPYRRWYRFGWAFPWQVLLLLMAVAVSACLPFFHRASLDRGETDSATKPPDRVETQVSAPDQTNTAPH